MTIVAAVRYGRHLPEGRAVSFSLPDAARSAPVGVPFRLFGGEKTGQGHRRGQPLSSQSDRPASAGASARPGHCRTPGLSALRLAGPANDPLDHDADGRADRSQELRSNIRRGMWSTTSRCGSPSFLAALNRHEADGSRDRGKLVLQERIELSTSPLPRECSTTELLQPLRADFRPRRTAGFCHSGAAKARTTSRRRRRASADGAEPAANRASNPGRAPAAAVRLAPRRRRAGRGSG